MTRITIDGRALSKEGSSISVYLYNLLTELIKDKRYYFYLVTNTHKYHTHFKQFNNVQVKYVNIANNIIWDNIVIPYYSVKTKSHIIFFPKSSSCWFKLPHKKIVVTIHGMIYQTKHDSFSTIEKYYWIFAGKIASIVSDIIIAVSENDRLDLLAEGYSDKKLYVLPIGISNIFSKRYEISATHQTLTDYNLQPQKYFIQVGHITQKKNQLFTLDLFKELSEIYTDVKLLFVGSMSKDKHYYQALMARIHSVGIGDKVIFAGIINQNVQRSVLPILLQHALIAYFPSTYEGFGMPAVEAMASGVPVLSSNRGALPSVIGNQNVLPLENKVLWIQQTRKLVENAEYKHSIIDNQRRIIRRYNWNSISKQLLSLFEGLQA